MKLYVILKCDNRNIQKIVDVLGITADYDNGVKFCKRKNETQSDYFYKIQYCPFKREIMLK